MPHRVEGDVTEIEQAREADDDVEAERQQHERMARLVMRTQAVPIIVSARAATRTIAISAMPIQAP